MFLVLPIRTQSCIHRTPRANYALLSVNVVAFLLLNDAVAGEAVMAWRDRYLAFHSDAPAFHEFFTYQFLHGDMWHILGNMLFLWVFGNSVNAKLGDWPYLLFYLAGGAFAAWGFAVVTSGPSHLVGASGAIAAVTTAYLALFPRSRVTVLAWVFLFIHFFELPAIVIIVLKIIVWDNLIAPSLGSQGAVAHSAHLAGYLFGFVGALGMLLVRAIPRDQFDILALWKRWHQRRQFTRAVSDPAAAVQAQYGAVGRVAPADPVKQAEEDGRLDEIADLRSRIADALEQDSQGEAVELYEKLTAIDALQCLSERHQLQIARGFYGSGALEEAAGAFERFVECYSSSTEAGDVRLLLGIIYARDLRNYEQADEHLTKSIKTVRDPSRREQCLTWLKDVRAALDRPFPEGETEH